MNISLTSYPPSGAASRTDKPTVGQASSKPVQWNVPLVDDVVNFTGLATSTAAVSAATSSAVAVGLKAGQALGAIGAGGAALVAGALVGGLAGRAIAYVAATVSNVKHSKDEYLGYTALGALMGGAGAACASLLTGVLGASPATTAFIAGIGVLAVGIDAIATKFRNISG